jgi:hypothetical protein
MTRTGRFSAIHESVDKWIDRIAKLAGILLPVVIAIFGWSYNANKDKNDKLLQVWDKMQKKYANMTALMPLLTSSNPASIRAGMEIFTAEAKDDQAPLVLQPTIERIKSEHPELQKSADAALNAAQGQQLRECPQNPDGLYIHVSNSTEQLAAGQLLAASMTKANVVRVQGAQRVDASPPHAQLRFYFSETNKAEAAKIEAELAKYGVREIKEQDLSPRYLRSGCAPPRVYELWVGSDAPLSPDGSARH